MTVNLKVTQSAHRFVFATVLLLSACRSSTPSQTSTSTVIDTSTTTTTTTTTLTTTTATSTQSPRPELHSGSKGADVSELQRQLKGLGYWLDDANGTFSYSTYHAVTALQKAADLKRDGVAGSDTQAALTKQVVPIAHSQTGHAVEIDLRHQLLLIVDDGKVKLIIDTSTGMVAGTTPPGQWRVYRQVDGIDHSPLGLLYRPKYFYEGVAIHGYSSVPPYPASHGCVRVTNDAMDFMWSTNLLTIGTAVWVY